MCDPQQRGSVPAADARGKAQQEQQGLRLDLKHSARRAQQAPNHTLPLKGQLWASGAHGGDRRELADELGLSERTLYRRLRAHRDDPAD